MATCSTPRVGWSGALFRSLRPKKILHTKNLYEDMPLLLYHFFLFFSSRSYVGFVPVPFGDDVSRVGLGIFRFYFCRRDGLANSMQSSPAGSKKQGVPLPGKGVA